MSTVLAWSMPGPAVMQELGVACPPVLRALTAACQNDYNSKAVAKQGGASVATKLLLSTNTEVVFEAVCLLYTLTTEAEARLAVGQALVKAAEPGDAVAVSQLFALMAGRDAGAVCVTLPAGAVVLDPACVPHGTIKEVSVPVDLWPCSLHCTKTSDM